MPRKINKPKVTMNDIRDADRELEILQHKYLYEHGWTYSSSRSPGCFWLWYKDYNSQKLMGGTELALKMEQYISQE